MLFLPQVYSILTAQLVLTMAFIGLFFIPAVKVGSEAASGYLGPWLCSSSTLVLQEFVKAHSWLVWVAFALTFLLIIVLACVPDVSRKRCLASCSTWHPISPQNLLLLWLLTCCIGFTLGQCLY